MHAFLCFSVALCLSASVHAGGFAVNVHRIESTRSKLIRRGKFGVQQKLTSTVHRSRLASNRQPLIDYDDGEYIAHVSIGTPPQRFLVALSLATGAFWVPDKTCPTKACPSYCKDSVYCKSICDPRCCSAKRVGKLAPSNLDTLKDCGWRNRFDSSKSSSYRKNGTQFSDPLSAPSTVGEGFIGVDTVTLGDDNGLMVRSQTFGQATSAGFPPSDAYDGILGLGTPSLYLPGMVPLLANAKNQKVVKGNVATVALMRDGVDSPDLPGGTITYGGVDTKNCDSKVTYIPAADDDPSELPLARISFGAFEEKSAKWTATLSFDGTALKGPADVMDGLAKVAGATKNQYDLYKIDCNATVPSLFLTLGDQRLEIPPSELVKPLDATNSDCFLSVSGAYSDFYVGAALARKNCLVFDYDNVKLGFSANLYSLTKG